MTTKTYYLALRLLRTMETTAGTLFMDEFADDAIGVAPVFRTKTAARKHYGKNVKLVEIVEVER